MLELFFTKFIFIFYKRIYLEIMFSEKIFMLSVFIIILVEKVIRLTFQKVVL